MRQPNSERNNKLKANRQSLITYLTSLICLALLSSSLTAQYAPPLKGPLLVTGTFGELRSDHWHAGLDFRATIGTPVYAVADGYVSRIKVSPGGYGQAVYLDHPDGYRSVYGHLERLAPELLDTIRAVQYARESFAVDLSFEPNDFPVTSGQAIGEVGNRGHSFGAHLHFEMREIEGDAPVNPLAFGFPVPDTRQPQLRQLRIYELDNDGHRQGQITLAAGVADTVVVRRPRIGIGIKAYDRQNAMPNWNGIYAARLLADTTEVFSFAYDRISFEDTEYLNALTDYADWKRNKSWFYLLWAGTREAVFWGSKQNGAFDGTLSLQPNRPLPLEVVVADRAGNLTSEDFVVVYRPPISLAVSNATEPHQYFLPAAEPSIIDNEAMRLELPKGALYEDLYFRYLSLDDRSANRLSATHQIHDRFTPLHGRARLYLRPRPDLPSDLRDKVYVGKCDEEGRLISRGGEWMEDGRMRATIGSFGDYVLLLDTLPPEIAIERFPTDLRRTSGFSLLLGDETEAPLQYRATVDDQWILMEYDAKNGRLSHTFEEGRVGAGEHRFELTVTDAQGNAATFRRDFRR